MHLAGYREMFVRTLVWDGISDPQHARVFVRLAPADVPGAVVALASNDGTPDSWFGSGDIGSISASSDGWTFFGFGPAGVAAAGLAAGLDRLIAPWELHFSGARGYVHLYAHHGPPPLQGEWARVEERMLLRAGDLTHLRSPSASSRPSAGYVSASATPAHVSMPRPPRPSRQGIDLFSVKGALLLFAAFWGLMAIIAIFQSLGHLIGL